MDTILYEIDMLRHCSTTVAGKLVASSGSEHAKAEYFLGIEGFLLHLRNLIAFFTTDHSRPHDLVLSDPNVWLGKELDEKEYVDLRERMRAFDDTHGEVLNDGKKHGCHELISKFLQHCTPARYEHAVAWEIEKMCAELEPVLAEFEKRFVPPEAPAAPTKVTTWAQYSHSTATTRTFSTPVLRELGGREQK